MAKAMLIMDMPQKCEECMLCYLTIEEKFCLPIKRPIITDVHRKFLCPLREVPQKKEDNLSIHIPYNEGYLKGWNDCIDEMLVGVEGLPTISETEILRKAFERVVERLEDLRAKPTETVYDTILVGSIIRILKEECGINE